MSEVAKTPPAFTAALKITSKNLSIIQPDDRPSFCELAAEFAGTLNSYTPGDLTEKGITERVIRSFQQPLTAAEELAREENESRRIVLSAALKLVHSATAKSIRSGPQVAEAGVALAFRQRLRNDNVYLRAKADFQQRSYDPGARNLYVAQFFRGTARIVGGIAAGQSQR